MPTPNVNAFLVESTDDNIVVGHYGKSGIGKTVDLGYSFPNALFIAAPGALLSIEKTCGFKPYRHMFPTIMDATKALPELAGHFSEIVFDDFSFLCNQTASALEGKYQGFKFWGKLRDVVIDFRNACRYAKVRVIAISCWEKPPKESSGIRIRGGMDLPSKMPEEIPALCDMVLRAQHEPQRVPWPVVYRCQPSSDYTMKDRFDVATRCDPAPMNFAELLRAGGVHIPRYEAFTKQESEVETISTFFGPDLKQNVALANEAYQQLVATGTSPFEARWTLRDALDRATIRRAQSAASNTFIQPSGELGGI